MELHLNKLQLEKRLTSNIRSSAVYKSQDLEATIISSDR